MKFIPDESQHPTLDVPYFDEAKKVDGWQGQGTTRSYDSLKSDVTQAFARLGGVVNTIQRGMYDIGKYKRSGVQINYSIEGPGGQMIYGRLDVAALPVQEPKQYGRRSEILRNRHSKALGMALYNVVQALKAQWVLKQLNPAYIPLMPWLLGEGDRTISELYAEAGYTRALPKPLEEGESIMGEFKEVDRSAGGS